MSAAERIRAEHQRIRELTDELAKACATIRRQDEVIAYLQLAVDLLSLPRVTQDDVRAVRDGLLALTMPTGGVQ